jgi:hypothetical protein
MPDTRSKENRKLSTESKRIIDIYRSFKKRRKTAQLNELYSQVKRLQNSDHLNDGQMTVDEDSFIENFRELPISIEDKRSLLQRVRARKRRLSKYTNQNGFVCTNTVYDLKRVSHIRPTTIGSRLSSVYFGI